MDTHEATAVMVLAAGKGSRMGMSQPKVLAHTGSGSLLHHVLCTASALGPERIVVVVGHGAELVQEAVRGGASAQTYDLSCISFAHQQEQRGTGDAARIGLEALKDFQGSIVILYGDVPLIEVETLQALLVKHTETKSTLSVLTVLADRPGPYGRIVRAEPDAQGRRPIQRIVEAKDCNESELLISEINSGVYVVDSAFLRPAVSSLENQNTAKEFYLTDIVSRAVQEGQSVSTFVIDDMEQVRGVNTPTDLSQVLVVLQRKRVDKLISSGVIIDDPRTVYIEESCSIAPGARIGPNVQIRGSSHIGAGVSIEGSAYILNSHVGDHTTIKFSVRMEAAQVGAGSQIGPFAHLRPGSELGKHVKVGNFVETKKAKLADGVKASHLSYLGDCSIGEQSNIGAGTITCNYDGKSKHETHIGKNVFVGSDSVLIAPVTLHDGCYIGAGSVIRKDVEADALALSRSEQVVKKGWVRTRGSKA